MRKQGSATPSKQGKNSARPPSPTKPISDDLAIPSSPPSQMQQQQQWHRMQQEKRQPQESPPRQPPKSPPRSTTLSSSHQESQKAAATRTPHGSPTSPVENIPPPPPPFFPAPKIIAGSASFDSGGLQNSSFLPVHSRKESIESMTSTAAVKNHPCYTGPMAQQAMTEVEERDGGEDRSQNPIDSDAPVVEQQMMASLGIPKDSRQQQHLPKRWHSEYTKKPADLRLETPLSITTEDSSVPNSPSFYTQNPPVGLASARDPTSQQFEHHLSSLTKSGRHTLVEKWMLGAHPFWDDNPSSSIPPHHHANLPPFPMTKDMRTNQPAWSYRKKEHFYEDPDIVMSSQPPPATSPMVGHSSHLLQKPHQDRQVLPSSATVPERLGYSIENIAPYAVVNKYKTFSGKQPQQTFATDV